jgi:hypothetical protein
MPADLEGLPSDAVGLVLCKIVGKDDLRMSEAVVFMGGRHALETTLRRAAIAGKVGPVGEAGTFFADIVNADGDQVETIKLDRKSWNSLKNKWAKCRMMPA